MPNKFSRGTIVRIPSESSLGVVLRYELNMFNVPLVIVRVRYEYDDWSRDSELSFYDHELIATDRVTLPPKQQPTTTNN